MRRFAFVLSGGLLASALFVGLTAGAQQHSLGNAADYAVMAATTITSTGPTVIDGSLAISPDGATSVTGFPPGVVTGATDFNNAAAIAAAVDLGTAYNDAAAEPFTVDLTGQDLGGLTLTPGVYRFSSSAQLTGTLILDGEGSTNPTFIFQIGSTLTTASASHVQLINGAGGCAVFWQIGSSATLGTTTDFQGTILALTSITVTTGVTIGAGGGSNGGRALALNAAVTLDSNLITSPSSACVFAPAATPTPVPTDRPVPTDTPAPTAVPTPVPTDTPAPTAVPTPMPTVVPAGAIIAIPTAVPSAKAAILSSPIPSTVGPVAALPTAAPSPSVPNTSSDPLSPPRITIASLAGMGLLVLVLALTPAIWRPRRESNPRRRP